MSTGTDWTNWRSPYDDGRDKTVMIDRDEALAGRGEPLPVRARHPVLGTPLTPPFPASTRTLVVALGCFWGAERHFWTVDGVHTTAAGYAGGYTRNPTYEQVCSARTGHAESVLIVYNPAQVGVEQLLGRFWEAHDPTQGMRQGHDVGTQYRSAIFYSSDHQRAAALRSRDVFQSVLHASGYGEITTAIRPLDTFFYAEEFHQQLLAREPGGYCGAGGTGLSCPIGLDVPTPPENH